MVSKCAGQAYGWWPGVSSTVNVCGGPTSQAAVAAQVRSTVADLLPALGMPRAEAVALIRKG
jgi:hypothetical protein